MRAPSGHQETQAACGHPSQLKLLKPSVSLLIKWKQASYFVCLAGGGGGETSCYYKTSLKMGSLAYGQQGLGPKRVVAAAASGLGLTRGLLGHYIGEWCRVVPTEGSRSPFFLRLRPGGLGVSGK